jgi:uncharacterized protein
MLFNVSGLLRGSVGATRNYEVEPATVLDDGDRFDAVHGPVRMMRTDRGVLVEGRFEAAGADICSRCLTPVQTNIEVKFEEEYYPINPFPGAGIDYEHPYATGGLDDTVSLIDDRNEIDLTDVVRQALVAARPMAPLCRAECRGICPVCHADRNVRPCDHDDSDVARSPLRRLAQEWRKVK